MPSINTIKLIRSLEQKKFRKQHGLFVAEGEKAISELLQSDQFIIRHLFITSGSIIPAKIPEYLTIETIADKELSRISFQNSPDFGLAVLEIPEVKPVEPPQNNEFSIVLDSIRDPGNLGTIIRLCDWFGVKNIICSDDTVDFFSPKVIQASMGSFCRVNVHYTGLHDWLKSISETVTIYGTTMNGANLNNIVPQKPAVIVIGSESHGISPEIQGLLHEKITIPSAPDAEAESLNAAMACSITTWHFFSH
jgi:RNA methyltransferase, TrmH family